MSTPQTPEQPWPSSERLPEFVGSTPPTVPRPSPVERGSGPGEFLTRWLIVRRPARLVVDGLIVLALAGLAYIAWVALAYPDGMLMPPIETTRLQRNLLTLVLSAYNALWYLGVVLVVFGCVRQVGDGLAGRGTT